MNGQIDVSPSSCSGHLLAGFVSSGAFDKVGMQVTKLSTRQQRRSRKGVGVAARVIEKAMSPNETCFVCTRLQNLTGLIIYAVLFLAKVPGFDPSKIALNCFT